LLKKSKIRRKSGAMKEKEKEWKPENCM